MYNALCNIQSGFKNLYRTTQKYLKKFKRFEVVIIFKRFLFRYFDRWKRNAYYSSKLLVLSSKIYRLNINQKCNKNIFHI